MYILRTRLLENREVSFYYKGTSTEKGVPFALNTIVAFEPSDAMHLDNKQTAIALCEKLNFDKSILAKVGYDEFEMIAIDKDIKKDKSLMCCGIIIGPTASAVPGRNRLSTPNDLSKTKEVIDVRRFHHRSRCEYISREQPTFSS